MEWIIEPNESIENADDTLYAACSKYINCPTLCISVCKCPSKMTCYCSMSAESWCK